MHVVGTEGLWGMGSGGASFQEVETWAVEIPPQANTPISKHNTLQRTSQPPPVSSPLLAGRVGEQAPRPHLPAELLHPTGGDEPWVDVKEQQNTPSSGGEARTGSQSVPSSLLKPAVIHWLEGFSSPPLIKAEIRLGQVGGNNTVRKCLLPPCLDQLGGA